MLFYNSNNSRDKYCLPLSILSNYFLNYYKLVLLYNVPTVIFSIRYGYLET